MAVVVVMVLLMLPGLVVLASFGWRLRLQRRHPDGFLCGIRVRVGTVQRLSARWRGGYGYFDSTNGFAWFRTPFPSTTLHLNLTARHEEPRRQIDAERWQIHPDQKVIPADLDNAVVEFAIYAADVERFQAQLPARQA